MINVSKIDQDLKPYLDPNDRFNQTYVIEWIKDEDVAAGMCRSLAMFWMIRCLEGKRAPNICLREMKQEGKSYFQLLANAQKNYADLLSNEKFGSYGSMVKVLQLASKDEFSIKASSLQEQGATTLGDFVDVIGEQSERTNTTPRAVLISLKMKGAAHAIAIVEETTDLGSRWHIFDPNFGVLQVDASLEGGQKLEDALKILWNHYDKAVGMKAALVYAVTK